MCPPDGDDEDGGSATLGQASLAHQQADGGGVPEPSTASIEAVARGVAVAFLRECHSGRTISNLTTAATKSPSASSSSSVVDAIREVRAAARNEGNGDERHVVCLPAWR